MKFKTGKYLLFFCLVGLVWAGCKVNDDAPAVTTNSSISVMNLVANSSSINYYDNGTRQNNYKLGYGLTSGYLTVISGDQTASIKDTLYNTIYSAGLTLFKNTKYTLLVAGQSKQAVNGILLTDTIAPVNGKAKARVVNASGNAPAFDVYFNNVGVTNISYKGISKVALVDTGTVTLKIKQAGTNSAIGSFAVKLSTSSVYTFYIYGLYNNTTGVYALSLGTIINN